MPKKKEIKRLESSKKVNMGGGISISGNVESSSINAGNINAQNIAGGSTNVYVVSQNDEALMKFMLEALEKENLSKGDKKDLKDLLDSVDKQLNLGEEANEGKLNFLLHYIRNISPSIFDILVRYILSQADITPQIRRLIKGGLERS
jgi:hypothetical protein